MTLRMGTIEYPSLEGKVSDAEWRTRVELAALYRSVELLGWNDLTQAPISAKIPDEPHYLFNPIGIMFDEITASSLIKVDLDGNLVSETAFEHLLPTWYALKAVHEARSDANFVIHSHDDYTMALSARKDKLLPISQPAGFAIAAGIAYHDYDGVETYPEQIPGLQRSLGNHHVMILHNHGAVVVAPTAWFALYIMSSLRKACRVQLFAGQSADLIHLSAEAMEHIRADLHSGPSLGDAWESWLRRLDRTDPSYKQ